MGIAWIDEKGLVLDSPRMTWVEFEKVLQDLGLCLRGDRLHHTTAAAVLTACPTLVDLLTKEACREAKSKTVGLADECAGGGGAEAGGGPEKSSGPDAG